jgi:copper chaperone NosL
MNAPRHRARPAPLVGPPLTRRQALASIGLGLLGLTLAGCARQEAADQPPPIRYGEDVCTACNMIINEAPYAAAYRTTAGEVRLFDDLGELAAYHRQQREPVRAFFVHHYETQEWLRAETAFFVATRTLRTPMGYGIAAVASEPEAQALAQRLDGKVVGFPDFLEQLDLSGRMGGMGGRHGR